MGRRAEALANQERDAAHLASHDLVAERLALVLRRVRGMCFEDARTRCAEARGIVYRSTIPVMVLGTLGLVAITLAYAASCSSESPSGEAERSSPSATEPGDDTTAPETSAAAETTEATSNVREPVTITVTDYSSEPFALEGDYDVSFFLSDNPACYPVALLQGNGTHNRSQVLQINEVNERSGEASLDDLPAGEWIVMFGAFCEESEFVFTPR